MMLFFDDVGCPDGFGPASMNLTQQPRTTGEHAMDKSNVLYPGAFEGYSSGVGSNDNRDDDSVVVDSDDDSVMARTLSLSMRDNTNDDDDGGGGDGDGEYLVTADNVEEYVELYSSAILRWNVIDQLNAMRNGMMEFIPPSAWRGGSPMDFNLLIGGTPNITAAEIKLRTQITGSQGGTGGASIQLISTWFWTIVESMTQLQRSKLLYFSTGSTRLSSDTTKPSLLVEVASNVPGTSLPTSVTCSLKLVLPAYSSFEQLQEKLLLAIENCNNYELQ